MKKTMRIFMAVLFMAAAVIITGTVTAEAATKKMSRADFIKAVVQQVRGKKDKKGKKITVTFAGNGSVKVGSKTVSSKTVKGYKTRNKVTATQAKYIAAAVQLGIADKDIRNAKKNITYGDAMAMLARAYRVMNGDRLTDADVDLVVNGRLTGLYKIEGGKQADIAKAWMLGFYAGKSDGKFTKTRTIKYSSAASKTDLTAMVKRLTSAKDRYKLSPDFQMLRISKKNRPKQEKYFPYILDDFTNDYYDMEFEFMQKTTYGYADMDLGSEYENVKTDISLFTWDNVFKKMPYAKRAAWILDYHKRNAAHELGKGPATNTVKLHSQYILPSELKKFVRFLGKNNKGLEISCGSTAISDEEIPEMVALAEEYARTVFNVNYETIDEFTYGSGPVRYSDGYIRDAVLNETVIECDQVAADPGSIYYQVNYNGNRVQGYVIRVYVHYRIVSDNGKGSSALVYNSQDEAYPTSLREVKVSKDGLSYEWAGNDGKWRDGYFEVAFPAGARGPLYSVFDLKRSRNHYTELLGGPDQKAYDAPGGSTGEGCFYNMNGIREKDTPEIIKKLREVYTRDYGKYHPISY